MEAQLVQIRALALGFASLCGWPIVAVLGVSPLCLSRSSWSSGRQGGESGGLTCVDACEFLS